MCSDLETRAWYLKTQRVEVELKRDISVIIAVGENNTAM
jgi:hypothetical protein